MTNQICAAPNPNDRNNNHQHQPLTPRQARALVAALSRKAEEAIAADMVADHLELHPATTAAITQPTTTACPSPDKKAGSTTPVLFTGLMTTKYSVHLVNLELPAKSFCSLSNRFTRWTEQVGLMRPVNNTTPTTYPYLFDRSRLTSRSTPRSGYHFDTDAPRSFPLTTYSNHTTNN